MADSGRDQYYNKSGLTPYAVWGESATGDATPQEIHSDYTGSDIDISGLAKTALAGRARGELSNIYEQNWLRNKLMMDEAYARSLPKPITGPAGMVTFDEDEEEMLMELDEGTKALRDSWFKAGLRAEEELGAYDIDERTIKKIGMFDAANYDMDRARQQELVALNYAQGIEGTPGYWKQRALDDQKNQRRLREAIESGTMALGERGLLSAESLAFGNAAIDAPRMAMTQAELSRLIGSGAHTGVNAAGASLASMALADTQAGFWSGLMGGMGQYGAPKTGASTTAAAGNTDRYSSSPMMGGGDWLSQILSQIV